MRWLSFVASLVLLLCTTEAVRVSLRSSSPPPATHYGPEAYDSFASVVGRVGDNAVAEERFLRTNLMETRSQCRHEIRKLKQSLENHQTILTAANKTHTLNLHKANVSRTHILELEPIIEAKKQMLNALEMDINAGEVHMKQAHEIAHNKTHDAKVVITAVRALFSLLSAMNGAPDLPRPSKPAMFMFRQKLKDAKQHIKDPNVMRFLQTAMSSMSASGTTPSGSDLAKLQLLLSLLQAQMKDYIASVKDNIKLEKDNWDTQITQMDQQRLLLKKEIDEREADVAKLRTAAEGAELAAKGNNATLHGPEVKEIKLLTEQLNVTKHDCRRKLHNIKVALIQIQKQLHVTSSVGDMQFTPDDNNLLGHISANVEPPKKTLVDSSGKRCCRMCSVAKGLKACGDSCIASSSSCSSVEGCACTNRD